MDKDLKQFLDGLQEKYAGGRYIFRGLSKQYGPKEEEKIPREYRVNSSLHRYIKKLNIQNVSSYPENTGTIVRRTEKDLVERSKRHFEDKASNIEILTDLQHYGQETNLIDFSRSLYKALFFVCNKDLGEDGELILLDLDKVLVKKDEDIDYEDLEDLPDPSRAQEAGTVSVEPFIIEPSRTQTSKDRVIAQDSIFAYAPQGYLKKDVYKAELVQRKFKKSILKHLREFHNIYADTIYGDLIGFMANERTNKEFWKHVHRAIGHQSNGHYKKAEECFKEAENLKPDSPELYYNRGLMYHIWGRSSSQQKYYDSSIKNYSDAIGLKRNYVAAYYNRGIAYAERNNVGDIDRAIKDFTKAIEIKPDYAAAYNNRGNIYRIRRKQGDLDQAIEDYGKVIELKPDSPEAHNNRGMAYAERNNVGDIDQAIKDFTKAIALRPDDCLPWFYRGVVRLRREEWDKAREDLMAAKEKGADIARMFFKESGSIPGFESKYQVRLPDDIREMLTPDAD